jgi:hypothetical protein
MGQHRAVLVWLEESRSHVVLAQHGDVRPVEQLARLQREGEHALQERQLAIDFRIARGAALRGRALPNKDGQLGLPLQHVRAHVAGRDVRHAPAGEIRREMLPDAPFTVTLRVAESRSVDAGAQDGSS